jgi:putative Ca2+/H+ antiporter (TMEM165/GDT1 family)
MPRYPESGAPAGALLPVSYKNLIAALLAGLALRLFFIAHYPFVAGDTKFYVELARNWLDRGVYGLFVNGQLVPVDMRVPGYPAFLAAIYRVFGRANYTVMLAQVAVDLATCIVASLLAARIAPAARRTAAATAALWMAALCPVTANYTSAVLTETLSALFTTLAFLALAIVVAHPFVDSGNAAQPSAESRDPNASPYHAAATSDIVSFAGCCLLAGVIVGLGALVRPETPLLLLAAGLVLLAGLGKFNRAGARIRLSKLLLAIVWLAAGLLLALAPWAARNALTLGRVQFLAPYYAQSEGDFMPAGFYAWTRTWMTSEDDNYFVPWKLGKAPIPIDTLPHTAFDSPTERARVASLLDQYNASLRINPLLDHQFRVLARERTARHPLRTYGFVPAAKIFETWFRPRVELLHRSGDLWPPAEKWRDNPRDFDISLGVGLINLIYISLALAGAWICRSNPVVAMIVGYFVLRSAFLATLPTIEPRYVVACFPALAALGAQALAQATSPAKLETAARVPLRKIAS